MNDHPLALARDPDPPVDRLGWRPPRASPWSELARDLWPAFWRGGLAVGVVGLGVALLVRGALSDLERLVEEQYQVQQVAVARHARDRLVTSLDGVVRLLEAVRDADGPAPLRDPRLGEAAAVTRAVYRIDADDLVAAVYGTAPDRAAARHPRGSSWLTVHPRDAVEPALLCIGIPAGGGWMVADVDLARLNSRSVGAVERYMSGYPWVVDSSGLLVAAPSEADLGTRPFSGLDGPQYVEFSGVLDRMLHGDGEVVGDYGWPDAEGVPRRRLAASTAARFLGERLVVAVSADAADVTKLARDQVRSLLALGLLLATGVGAVGPVALALQARVRQSERRAVRRSIASLVRAMEARDPYTRGHSENVAYYAARLAETMGYPADVAARVYQGGLLHDLGKIGVPDAVLHKPARLDAPEMERMRRHPCLGHEILSEIESLGDVVAIVRHHHEKMDGTGYPDGLAGERIPVEARIVAVADVLDALTTDRPYRAGMPLAEALRVIEGMRGTHLDPTFVDGLLGSIDGIWDARRVSVPGSAAGGPTGSEAAVRAAK